jgi:hypothetical protein
MVSESSGKDFSARIFTFCTNFINVIIILACVLGDQKVIAISKTFTFV